MDNHHLKKHFEPVFCIPTWPWKKDPGFGSKNQMSRVFVLSQVFHERWKMRISQNEGKFHPQYTNVKVDSLIPYESGQPEIGGCYIPKQNLRKVYSISLAKVFVHFFFEISGSSAVPKSVCPKRSKSNKQPHLNNQLRTKSPLFHDPHAVSLIKKHQKRNTRNHTSPPIVFTGNLTFRS